MNTLNTKLFDSVSGNIYKLKPDIRSRLIEIAKTFQDYIEQDGLTLNVIDVRLVGSNAGFDYNEFSDVDLHLVADLDCMCCDPAILQVALNAERTKFNSNLDITVKGIPVELYVEDIKTGVNSNGVYSIIRDAWVKCPKPEDPVPENILFEVSNKTAQWVALISKALIRKNENELQHIINRLYLMRKDGLDTGGRYSCGNLIFKEIRKQGYLEKLKVAKDEAMSQRLTLECRIAQEALKYGSSS